MNMPLVDVAIGLALVYLLLSILCSSFLEMLSGLLDLRGEMLWRGIESMLGGQGASGGVWSRLGDIANASWKGQFVAGVPSPATSTAGQNVAPLSAALFAHPVVDSMRSGTRAPSYLTASQFANALVDSLAQTYQGGTRLYADIGSTVHALPPGPLKKNLEMILSETGGDVGRVKQRIEAWYDEVMQRVTGWYKRQTQWLLLAIGLVAAVGLNVDSIELSQRLWRDPTLRSVATQSAQAYVTKHGDDVKADVRAKNAKGELDALQALELPIGWPAPWQAEAIPREKRLYLFCGSLLGWFITALAISLGAPYWYDMLLKLLPMSRSSGGKPQVSPAPAQQTSPPQPGAPSPAPAMPGAQQAGGQSASPGGNKSQQAASLHALNHFEATSLSREDVQEIQGALGMSQDSISGVLDDNTRKAIADKRDALGLPRSEELDPNFVRDLLAGKRSRP